MLEELALDCGLDATHACAMRERAVALREITTSHGRHNLPMVTVISAQSRPLCCPRKPHLQINRDLAQDLAASIHRVASRSPKHTYTALRIWIEEMQHKRYPLRFDNLSQAGNAGIFRDLLVKMGVAYQWIVSGPASSCPALEIWRKKLHIRNEEALRFVKSPSRIQRNSVNWVSIQPHFADIQMNSGRSGVNGNEGFRYVMMMAWIYFKEKSTPAQWNTHAV
jgi:hypothetical protein